MKKILRSMTALALLMLLPTSMAAKATNVQYLVLEQEDGTETKFALTDYPVITFNEDGDMVVACNDQTVSFNPQTLLKHEIITEEIDETPSGIQTVQDNQDIVPNKPVVTFGQAEFSGLKEGQRVMVYSLDGKMVTSTSVNASGKASIDISALPKGVYILRAPNYSYKVSTK